MKTLIYLIFSFVLIGKIQAQDKTPNTIDKEDKRQGNWKILYAAHWKETTDTSKAIFYRTITYKDDKPTGKVRDYYKNGVVQMECTLLADRPEDIYDGIVIYYDKEGKKEKEVTYDYGRVISEKSFMDANSYEALWHKGNKLNTERKYKEAEFVFNEALIQAEKEFGKNSSTYIGCYGMLAMVYRNQRLHVKAESLYVEMKNMYEKTSGKESPSYSYVCSVLADMYSAKGLYAKAEPLLIEVNDIDKKLMSEVSSHYFYYLHSTVALADCYASQSLYVKADHYYKQSYNLFLYHFGYDNSHLTEKEKKAVLADGAHLYLSVYNFFTIQAHRQIPNLTAWAFNNSLVTKGLLFESTQKMRERILNSNDMPLKQLYEDWRIKRIAYSKALQLGTKECKRQNIYPKKLQFEANELEKQLSQKSELFAKASSKTRYTWQDVQKNLKKDEVIVEIIRTQYFYKRLTDSTLYMALIITPKTKNQPEMVVLTNGNEMEKENVSYYKNAIKFKKEDKISYNAFWKGIKAKLGKAKKVYFVPDGVYHQINLVTLQNPTTKEYLRSEIQIQLLSSSKDLIKHAENNKKQRKDFKDYQVHLFGYPTYGQKNDKISTSKEEIILSFSAQMDTTQRFFDANSGVITVLEGTKVEINNISKILTDKNIKNTIYLENKADEATVKGLKNPDILHIATHGFFLGDAEKFDKDNADKFRENPLLRSGLLLRDAEKGMRGEILEGEDGVLTAQEAINLNLDDTELVVMSACETGLGEIKNGEGVYGLQRSFQQAGAKTILMSLWKVDDVATQEVMTLFYNNLVAGKTKRQAFDDAQETLYKKYKNPYFWGAFVMVGE